MSLYTVTTGGQINAADINQLVNVLQRASGQTETGKYWLAGSSYANGALISQYIPSLSRGATPVSVSVDEADQAHNNCGAVSTNHLTANGFQVYSFGSGVFTSANVAGNYTIQY